MFVYLFKCMCVCVRLPAYPSVCILLKGVCVAPVFYSLSLHTSPKCIQKQRKQQSAAVDSNSQQRYKSSLQASNSILLRFGLSHHLWSDRTTNRHGGDGDFCGLSRLQVCRASFSVFFFYPTKENNGDMACSFNQTIHHNCAALQSRLFSPWVVSIFAALTAV